MRSLPEAEFCYSSFLFYNMLIISILNLVTSVISGLFLFQTESVLPISFAVGCSSARSLQDMTNYIFYGVTAAFSLTTLFGIVYASPYLLIPLQIWDTLRLGFTLLNMPHCVDSSIIHAVMILYCIVVQLCSSQVMLAYGHLTDFMAPAATGFTSISASITERHQLDPASTVISISEGCGARTFYPTAYTSHLSTSSYPAAAAAPPLYSSPQSYLTGASTPLTAAITSGNTQAHLVGLFSFSDDPPPPYSFEESQICCEYPPPYSP